MEKTIDLGSGFWGINLYRPFLALAMLLAMLKNSIQVISASSNAVSIAKKILCRDYGDESSWIFFCSPRIPSLHIYICIDKIQE